MKATVNKNTCIGCGICVDICPEIFEIDPQGLSEAMVAEVSSYYLPEAMNASSACPTNAIKIY